MPLKTLEILRPITSLIRSRSRIEQWMERETVEVAEMIKCLRETARAPASILRGKIAIAFPYYKNFLGGERCLMYVRRAGRQQELRVCIDIVRSSEERRYPESVGWFDFETRRTKKTNELVGEAVFRISNFRADVSRVIPEELPLEYYPELYVHPEIQRLGVGAALISSARVILDEIGANPLNLRWIELERAGVKKDRADFFHALGARFFNVGEACFEGVPVVVADATIPTEAIEDAPYIFK